MKMPETSGDSHEEYASDDDELEEAELEYLKMRQAKIKKLKRHFEKVAGEDGQLTLEDFRHALRSKNEFFTNRLFAMFDKQKDGSISLDEFISFAMDIKTVDDKMDLLFNLYDINDDGQLDKDEIQTVIRAMVTESQLRLEEPEVKLLSLSFYAEAVQCSNEVDSGSSAITREGFKRLLRSTEALSNDVSTLIDHWIGAVEDAEISKDESEEQEREDRAVDEATQVRVNPTFYHCFVIYVAIILSMMLIATILHWKSESVFLLCARIFGFPLNFICTIIYVCTLKNLLNALRSLGAIKLLPLDHSLFFHILSGWVIFVFGYIHTLAMCIHFKIKVLPAQGNYLSVNSSGNYSYLEWMLSPSPGLFGLVPGWANVTGCALMVLISLILLTSEDWVRRSGYFNLFHYSHLAHVLFAILLIIHAPSFSYFFPVAGVFVALQLLDRMCSSCRRMTYVTTGIILPSDTVCLVVRKPERYAHNVGDWIYVNIPSIASHEWHAFTITSSPDMRDVFTLHVKVIGNWTGRLLDRLESDYEKLMKNLANDGIPLVRRELKTLPHQYSQVAKIVPYNPPRKFMGEIMELDNRLSTTAIEMYIHGPFGCTSKSIFTAEHAVLICTGVGVTKMTPILHTVLHRYLSATHSCTNCGNSWNDTENPRMGDLKKVDFIWIVRDPTEVSWFLDLLAGIDLEQKTVAGSELHKIVDSHIYVTRALAKTDMCAVALRVALNLFYRRTNRDIVYGLKSKMIAGRPNFNEIFRYLARTRRGRVSVFYSGNSTMVDILLEKCNKFKFLFCREVF